MDIATSEDVDKMKTGIKSQDLRTRDRRSVGHEDSFAQLMERVRAGSDEAAEEMLQLCRPQIYRIVRRRLGKELRSQYDSDDFVQSVWQAFFEHRSRILQFSQPDSLVAFLSQVASNKVVNACRKRLSGGKEHSKREPLLNDVKPGSDELTSQDPTPSEAVIKQEDWDQLVEGQSDRQRKMIEMRANGARVADIAAELNVSPRTVRRVFEKLKRRKK